MGAKIRIKQLSHGMILVSNLEWALAAKSSTSLIQLSVARDWEVKVGADKKWSTSRDSASNNDFSRRRNPAQKKSFLLKQKTQKNEQRLRISDAGRLIEF